MEDKNADPQILTADQVVLFMDHLSPEVKGSAAETTTNNINPMPSQTTPKTNKTVRGLSFSKPKARFAEPNHLLPPKTIIESDDHQPLNPRDDASSSSDDDDEWFENIGGDGEDDTQAKYRKRKERKINKRALIEWTLFLIIMTCLVCSLTLRSLQHKLQWGLELWKWCLMILVLFCGRLVSGWVVGFLVFLIERNFMLREKVLYFVYGLRKSFQNCAWLGFALVSWMILFPNVHKHNPVLKKIFRALVAVLIGATIWLLKIVLVKVLASSFHVTTFFDRMKESVFHHFILDALSGPPLDETEMEMPPLNGFHASKSLPARLRNRDVIGRTVSKKFGSRRIDMERLKRLSLHRRATAWSVKRLVKYVRSSGLSTISKTVDEFEAAESEINSEWEARTTAQRIFKHVAKHGAK